VHAMDKYEKKNVFEKRPRNIIWSLLVFLIILWGGFEWYQKRIFLPFTRVLKIKFRPKVQELLNFQSFF
jgi:hypothetical protein